MRPLDFGDVNRVLLGFECRSSRFRKARAAGKLPLREETAKPRGLSVLLSPARALVMLALVNATMACASPATCPPGTVPADNELRAACVTHEQSCCRCLVGIDCLKGQPTEGECVEHVDDPSWLPVAVTDNACVDDNDACATWCADEVFRG
jgi:hypothetical protein